MAKFYPLKVVEKHLLTPESIGISLQVPDDLKDIFKFSPGQFVMVEKEIDGENLRRYYSIYSSISDNDIKLGIKLKGKDGFAEYAMNSLQVGDILQVSAPMNDVPFDIENAQNKKSLAITIGSGITPFYSIIRSVIAKQTQSKIVLVYGNHSVDKTMFYNELKSLMQQHPDYLQVYFVNSQDDKGDFQGRINPDNLTGILSKEGIDFDAIYMIGPDDLKKISAKILEEKGIAPDKMHYRVYS